MRTKLLLHATMALATFACDRSENDSEAEKRLEIGYIVNFMSHEWYQNICSAAEARAAELGTDLVGNARATQPL